MLSHRGVRHVARVSMGALQTSIVRSAHFESTVGPFWADGPNPPPLNRDVAGLSQSPTLATSELSNKLRAEGREVSRFGLGQSPFPVMEPMIERLREYAPVKDYLATAGLMDLREALASHTTDRVGGNVEYSPEHVIVGPGTKELIFLLQLCLDADLVLPAPSWVSYQPGAKMLGRRCIWVHSHFEDGFRLVPEELERALSAHMQYADAYPVLVILNYPSNPTGATFSEKELAAVAEVAGRYGAIVLSDEIYGRLTYSDKYPLVEGSKHSRQHTSIAKFYPEGTIILDGASKWAGAGGWRVGAFVFPPEMAWLHKTMVSAASETFSSVCAPVQYATTVAFDGSQASYIEDYLDTSNHILRLVSSFTSTSIESAGAAVRPAEGGFYIFPDFSGAEGVKGRVAREFSQKTDLPAGSMTSTYLCSDILEKTGVAILPGSAFGRRASELTARLAFVDFDGKAAQEAINDTASKFHSVAPQWDPNPDSPDHKLQAEFLQTHAPSVWRGVNALADYLKE